MPSSIPHQKFCFYHLPTWGRAGIKLGDAWYVSNVSIIFGCSMLLYYLFLPILGFRRKRISNGVQTEWNLRECDFWNEHDPEDLDPTSSNQRGRHEVGGRAYPPGTPSTLVGPTLLHRRTPSSYIDLRTLKLPDTEPKTKFHRRNLLYPWDPILGPFPELRRRGHRSWRASTSTP